MPTTRNPYHYPAGGAGEHLLAHDDPGKTKAYLAGLAAGRTEAAASPDERLREVERALLTVLREAAIIAGSHSDRRDWMVGAIRKQEQVIPELARAGRLILREADAPMEVTVDDVLAALAAADRDKEARDV